jgi:hypothetical protein
MLQPHGPRYGEGQRGLAGRLNVQPRGACDLGLLLDGVDLSVVSGVGVGRRALPAALDALLLDERAYALDGREACLGVRRSACVAVQLADGRQLGRL